MNLRDLARVLPGVELTPWQKAVAVRILGLDLESDLDRLGGYRRCGWYPRRPPRRRR